MSEQIDANELAPDPFQQMELDNAGSYNQGLTPLHPSQKSLISVTTILFMLLFVIIAGAVDFFLQTKIGLPQGSIIAPMITIALVLILFLPNRKYRRWGYDIEQRDENGQLRVLRGYLWRTDTIVPFNRIQHIDVAQGPLQRIFDLSTLVVHTAGTHNSIVSLPGLATPDAEAMREIIKGYIRQDMI